MPGLTHIQERETAEEGCLSLPSVHVEVERSASVRVRAQDETGEEVQIEAEGLTARVIQHEMDHLDGVLILDRISREARKEAMRAMREAADGEQQPVERERGDSDNGAHPEGDGPDDARAAETPVADTSGA